MTVDRRTAHRQHVALPAQIEMDGDRFTIALTRDISAKGALVLSQKPLAVGAPVTVHLLVDGHQYAATGKIVRHETLTAKESQQWQVKAAVELAGGDSELARLLATLGHES